MTPVKNKIEAPELCNTKIKGSIGELMELFFHHRVLSDEARNVVYQETEDAFRNKLDDESGVYGLWQGEFWGKWIISAACVCEYENDESIRQFIKKAAHGLMQYQEDNGYIGTYRDQMRVFACDRKEAEKVIGWPCNWNWNIWCRKYSLWGLVESYLLTEDAEILDGAVKLADHLIKQLHDNNINIADTGTFFGFPSCSILKPMLKLYKITENKKYMDFAFEIAACWEVEDGKCPNLLVNAFSDKPVHEWYEEPPEWGKVYEMLSCLEGLLELYHVTGDEKYYKAVEAIHAQIWEHERNPMFSVGFNDIFNHAASQLNSISEPCDAIHWLRVNYELFAITGESRFMDIFELTFYNAFLASICRDGKWGARGVRSSGFHMYATGQANMEHSHCCVNNMPRGYMNMAQAAVMRGDGAVYVNLYTDFFAELDGVKVEISGDYLSTGKAVVKIGSDGEQTVRLRIPQWSGKTVVNVNGKDFSAQAGVYFETTVSGDAELTLQFDMTPVIRKVEYLPLDEDGWYVKRWVEPELPYEKMIKRPMCVVTAGPLLLARSKYIGNTEEEMFAAESIYGKECTCSLMPIDNEKVRSAFEAEFTCGDSSFKTVVCDYASAGNEMLKDESFFSIFF